MDFNRYSRQTVFNSIGTIGQQKLLGSKVAVIGIGALGTVIANDLCRAGVGYIKLIDRDYVELSNLQRQTLFTERDAAEQIPKAIAAFEHLKIVNSGIVLEPVAADVNSSNIEELIKDMDLVMDGSDNAEVRYLINEACHKHKIPWIYGGAIGASGATMNILPDEGPCLKCFTPEVPAPGSYPTCSTMGVLNMITGIIASIQSAEAVKILLRASTIRKNLFLFDAWNNIAEYIEVKKNPDCPVCGKGNYEFLGQMKGSYTTELCGRESIQVVPAVKISADFKFLAEKLKYAGTVKFNRFMLSFDDGRISLNLFPDGRAIIKNVRDEMSAKSVYSEYIGL